MQTFFEALVELVIRGLDGLASPYRSNILSLAETWVGIPADGPMWHSPILTSDVLVKLIPVRASPTEILLRLTFLIGFCLVPCNTRAAADAFVQLSPVMWISLMSE